MLFRQAVWTWHIRRDPKQGYLPYSHRRTVPKEGEKRAFDVDFVLLFSSDLAEQEANDSRSGNRGQGSA